MWTGSRRQRASTLTTHVWKQSCPDPAADELLELGLGWLSKPPDKDLYLSTAEWQYPSSRADAQKDLGRSFLQGTFNSLFGKDTQGVGVGMCMAGGGGDAAQPLSL